MVGDNSLADVYAESEMNRSQISELDKLASSGLFFSFLLIRVLDVLILALLVFVLVLPLVLLFPHFFFSPLFSSEGFLGFQNFAESSNEKDDYSVEAEPFSMEVSRFAGLKGRWKSTKLQLLLNWKRKLMLSSLPLFFPLLLFCSLVALSISLFDSKTNETYGSHTTNFDSCFDTGHSYVLVCRELVSWDFG